MLLKTLSLGSNDLYQEFIYRRKYETTLEETVLKEYSAQHGEAVHFLSSPVRAECLPALAEEKAYFPAPTWPLSPTIRGENDFSETT